MGTGPADPRRLAAWFAAGVAIVPVALFVGVWLSVFAVPNDAAHIEERVEVFSPVEDESIFSCLATLSGTGEVTEVCTNPEPAYYAPSCDELYDLNFPSWAAAEGCASRRQRY